MRSTASIKERRTDVRSRLRRPIGAVQVLATKLYAERYGYLLGIATKNSANRDDAEEALHEAFILFIRHFDLEGKAPPLPWLILTLRRECWTKLHRERLDLRVDSEAGHDPEEPRLLMEAVPASSAGPAEAVERSERVAGARAKLLALKPAERRALGLIALGYSYREVGAITGWSGTKINRCASEGRLRLRELEGG